MNPPLRRRVSSVQVGFEQGSLVLKIHQVIDTTRLSTVLSKH